MSLHEVRRDPYPPICRTRITTSTDLQRAQVLGTWRVLGLFVCIEEAVLTYAVSLLFRHASPLGLMLVLRFLYHYYINLRDGLECNLPRDISVGQQKMCDDCLHSLDCHMQYGFDSSAIGALQAMPGFLKVFGYLDPQSPGGKPLMSVAMSEQAVSFLQTLSAEHIFNN